MLGMDEGGSYIGKPNSECSLENEVIKPIFRPRRTKPWEIYPRIIAAIAERCVF